MKDEHRVVTLNYNFSSEHIKESLLQGMIGIPNKPKTHGRRILDRATSKKPLYGVFYDVKKKAVVGIFTTVGSAFKSNNEVFSSVNERPEEHWEHRIHVMSMLTKSPILRDQFLDMGGKVAKGSMTFIPEQTWIEVKNHIIANG